MTANEMGDTFSLLYEAATLTNRQFNSREKSLFLNLAQKELLDTRFTPDANSKGKGFESDSKRVLDLTSLVRSNVLYFKDNNDFVRGTYRNGALRNPDKDIEGILTEPSTDFTGNPSGYGYVGEADDIKYGVLVELQDEVLHVISENCDMSYGDGTNKEWRYNVQVQEMPNDMYNTFIYNGLKQPYLDLVWRREYGSTIPGGITRNTNNFRSSKAPRVTADNTTTSPAINSAWGFNGSRKRIVQLIPGKNWEVEKYNVYYVKKPTDIVVDYNSPNKQIHCELHPHIHPEVIKIAVRMATAAIVPAEQKYQLTDAEARRDE